MTAWVLYREQDRDHEVVGVFADADLAKKAAGLTRGWVFRESMGRWEAKGTAYWEGMYFAEEYEVQS